jgi:hypothetical protein
LNYWCWSNSKYWRERKEIVVERLATKVRIISSTFASNSLDDYAKHQISFLIAQIFKPYPFVTKMVTVFKNHGIQIEEKEIAKVQRVEEFSMDEKYQISKKSHMKSYSKYNC